MHRILMLDDNQDMAQALKQRIQDFSDYDGAEIDLAATPNEAVERAKLVSQLGRSYAIFLIDRRLSPGKDGIDTMKELLEVSSDSNAIIFNGFENSEDRILAYEAGAKRYLLKTAELREILFVLKGVAQSRRKTIEEIRQRHQFKVAKEIAEAVGAELNLERTMEVILQKLSEVFGETSLCVLLYDAKLNVLKFAPATLKFYRIQSPHIKKKTVFRLEKGSIACRVARKSLMKKASFFENIANVSEDVDYIALNPIINSEFCISLLNTRSNLLGVLVLEREQINGFTDDDIELAKTVAQHLSIAIERAQISEELEYKSTIAAQTSWAAEIAHEINNEIYKIQSSTYLVKKTVGEDSDVYKQAETIEESALNLANAGQFRDRAPTLFEMDDDIKSYVRGISQKRSITPEFKLGTRGIQINVNRVGFHYIFKRLIDNASRAMKTQEAKKIFILTKLITDGKVEILFKDFGPGIDHNMRLSLFQRPVATKNSGGYGLLLIRQIIEGMNGQIVLKPFRSGRGAEFSIQIPFFPLTAG